MFLLFVARGLAMACPEWGSGSDLEKFCMGEYCPDSLYEEKCLDEFLEIQDGTVDTTKFKIAIAGNSTRVLDIEAINKKVSTLSYLDCTIEAITTTMNMAFDSLWVHIKFGTEAFDLVVIRDLNVVVEDRHGIVRGAIQWWDDKAGYYRMQAADPSKKPALSRKPTVSVAGSSSNGAFMRVLGAFVGVETFDAEALALSASNNIDTAPTSDVTMTIDQITRNQQNWIHVLVGGSTAELTLSKDGFEIYHPSTGATTTILNRERKQFKVSVAEGGHLTIGCTSDFATIHESLYKDYVTVTADKATVTFVGEDWQVYEYFSVIHVDSTSSTIAIETSYASAKVTVNDDKIRLRTSLEEAKIDDITVTQADTNVYLETPRKKPTAIGVYTVSASISTYSFTCVQENENVLLRVQTLDRDGSTTLSDHLHVTRELHLTGGLREDPDESDTSSFENHHVTIEDGTIIYVNEAKDQTVGLGRDVVFSGSKFYIQPDDYLDENDGCQEKLLLCQPELDCGKFEVLLRSRYYADSASTQLDLYGDPYEQICRKIDVKSTTVDLCSGDPYMTEDEQKRVYCVGYRIVNPIRDTWGSIDAGDTEEYLDWQSRVYDYTKSVDVTVASSNAAGRSLNFDTTALNKATVTGSNGNAFALDMTPESEGKIDTLTVSGVLDILSPMRFDIPVYIRNLEAYGGFARDNLSMYDFSRVESLTIPWNDFRKDPRAFRSKRDLTLTGMNAYHNIDISEGNRVRFWDNNGTRQDPKDEMENISIYQDVGSKLTITDWSPPERGGKNRLNLTFTTFGTHVDLEITASNAEVFLPDNMSFGTVPLTLTSTALSVNTASEEIPVTISCNSLALGNVNFGHSVRFTSPVEIRSGQISLAGSDQSVWFSELRVRSEPSLTGAKTLPVASTMELEVSSVELSGTKFKAEKVLRFSRTNALVDFWTNSEGIYDSNVTIEITQSLDDTSTDKKDFWQASQPVTNPDGIYYTGSAMFAPPAALVVSVVPPENHKIYDGYFKPDTVWRIQTDEDPYFNFSKYHTKRHAVCAEAEKWSCSEWLRVSRTENPSYVFDSVTVTPSFVCNSYPTSWDNTKKSFKFYDCLDIVYDHEGGTLLTDHSHMGSSFSDGEIGAIVIVVLLIVFVVIGLIVCAACGACCFNRKEVDSLAQDSVDDGSIDADASV